MSPSRGATRAGGDPKSQTVPTHWLVGSPPISSRLGRRPAPSVSAIPCLWHQHCGEGRLISLPGTLAGSVGTGTHSSLSRAVRVGIRPVQSSAQLRHPGWVFGSGGIFAAVLPWVPQSSGASSPLTLSLGSESASFLPPGRRGGERGTKRHLPVRGRWQGRRGRALPHAGEEWWW